MKRTLRLVILSEMRENINHDLEMLQDMNFVTSDVKEKQTLIRKINYTKELINEIDEMISEL